ncbi:hypothetical protein H0H81_004532 [Sphagnurus paluster]|uniref:Exosome complex protein n=1 Tax=Sphagnurus paluster TaxID=117069 RepID=A0A9P7GTB4_9AGAR|nr:hypothetical protein H0H81_004532 [Sphagnurus paluster]
MANQTDRAKGKLATLSSSFDDLEAILDPLFAQTLPESIVGLEPIQQAKLQTVLPYLVYDLVFKRVEIDKGAAQRFIKNAITQASYGKAPTPEEEAPGPSSSTRVQAKITSKMLERQLYEKRLKEQDANDSEEEEMQVFDGEDGNTMDVDEEPSKKGKGKAKEVPLNGDEPAKGRYGDDVPTSANSPLSGTSTPDSRHSKKRTIDDTAPELVPAKQTSDADSKTNSPAPGSKKKSKKVKKKSSKKSLTT